MAGQGHQFPGGFANSASGMKMNFVPNAMGSPMQGSNINHMSGQMVSNMSNIMNQAYNQNMQGQTGMQQIQQQSHQHSLQQNSGQAMPPAQSPVAPSINNNSQVVGNPSGTVQPANANKEFNTATLCKFGQETVQDIVSRIQEVFQTLKSIQPPNGTVQGSTSSNEKKAKVQEQLRTIRLLFKRLRLIYEKCNENCQGMEYTHIESLIPLKEDLDQKSDERMNSEGFKNVIDEYKELTEQVALKNKQLKEVIDHLRRIIWEINTMLTMRRS
uniref:Mediator of RNA polymerase II transcription subunit 30 n=1 Tax=Xenopsylla cheopis TaxID=163159 RepID=A0A6M2DIX8_XENCH